MNSILRMTSGFWRHTVWVLLGLGGGFLLLMLVGFIWFQVAIRQNPGNRFTQEGIQEILAQESSVYYRDGRNRIGTFFSDLHRNYVVYDSIPRQLVQALVAAEDQNYFEHGGWDIKGFAKAMVDNARCLCLRRGGSTLTQQAAKNLLGRKRSILGKAKELVNAYRLERNFSKEDILEFYLNQFYVAGNGHGVRIAGKYFFDKNLADLTLAECAFIAGSVKGPNQYNPFLQRTSEGRTKVLSNGRRRVGYVLNRMLQSGMITEEQYAKAREEKLQFKKGRFQFSLSTNMVKVKQILEMEPVAAALEKAGVEDFMKVGLQIHTTLDAKLQLQSEYALYRHLSRLQLRLEGYSKPDHVKDQLVPRFQAGQFYRGVVCSLDVSKEKLQGIQVQFGPRRHWLSDKGLGDFFKTWNEYANAQSAEPGEKQRLAWAKEHLSPGAPILTSVSAVRPSERDSVVTLNPETEPVIQGGALVLQEGRLLANVGGFGNTGYDRVQQARRQFGSTFKPLVYAAAVELGWSPLDVLPNHRQVFRLGREFYFPKPDHAAVDSVSIAWAGRKSENVASVYILYHLFDKTGFPEFWEIARRIGTAPENFPDQGAFVMKVRDTLGLVLNSDRMREVRYRQAVDDVVLDLTFDGRMREAEALKSLPYGVGYDKERERYSRRSDEESRIRARILERTYLRLRSKVDRVLSLSPIDPKPPIYVDAQGAISYFEGDPDPGWMRTIVYPGLERRDILVEGEISLGTLEGIAKRLQQVPEEDGSLYSRENLYASPDFRAMMALQYMVDFSRRVGIESRLDPVLSYPLGVNVITLSEAATAYQTLKDGSLYRSAKTGLNFMLVEKVTLRDGTVIYQDHMEAEPVLSERTRYALEGILHSVVEGGTGRKANSLYVRSGDKGGLRVSIPAYGKTGTTNDYRNGAFLGFIAGPKGRQKGFDAASGYTIGVYGGYDDNKAMVRRGFIGTGSSAALPAWIQIGQAVTKVMEYDKQVDFYDLDLQATGSAPRFHWDKFYRYLVSPSSGRPLTDREGRMLRLAAGSYSPSETGAWLRERLGSDAGGEWATFLIREE